MNIFRRGLTFLREMSRKYDFMFLSALSQCKAITIKCVISMENKKSPRLTARGTADIFYRLV